MEVWDLYDIEGHKLNKTLNRGDEIPSGCYHLVVHIIIKNSKGDYLIQKRSDNKDTMPGIWAFTGGSALSGESSEEAACRELSEETGIQMNINELNYHKRILRGNHLSDLWFGLYDVDVKTLKFQEAEVSALDFKSKNEIKKMIDSGEFHAYEDEYLKEVFKI